MPAEILTPDSESIAQAAAALLRGDVVGMPTETVYGLAGCVFQESALAKIFSVKERPTFDPLICHVAQDESDHRPWLPRLAELGLVDVAALSELAQQRITALTAAFWPGPLTLVLPKLPAVPDLATSGLPTVAVRCPRHRVAQALLRAVGEPLAAPSANRFGRISPTSASHVRDELGERISLILDGGDCEVGIESTVLLVEPAGAVWHLRPGGVSPAMILERTSISVERPTTADHAGGTAVPSPGLLASHYAPRKPLRFLPRPLSSMPPAAVAQLAQALPPGTGLGFLAAQGSTDNLERQFHGLVNSAGEPLRVVIESLSSQGDLFEAAHRLFAALRGLDDDLHVTELWAEPVGDDGGLGYAINDRLRRASHR
ncbi:MAG TPA: L-threonylcarbamoyladenylate synthase [Pirellulaceae bacterium]|nr:L-threonylcarbamoyladenylate synthase [Pirellulaceae bacterium]